MCVRSDFHSPLYSRLFSAISPSFNTAGCVPVYPMAIFMYLYTLMHNSERKKPSSSYIVSYLSTSVIYKDS